VKKIVYSIILLILILGACKQELKEKKSFTINGKFTNSSNEILTIYQRTPFEFIPLDSVKIDELGNFTIKIYSEEKDFFVLSVKTDYDIVLLIDTSEVLEISANLQNLKETYSVNGSPESKQIQLVEQKLISTKKVIDSLSIIYDKYLGTPDFDTIKQQLDKRFFPVLASQKEFSKNFIDANPTSLVNLIVISQYITPNAPVLDSEEDADYYFKVDSLLTQKYPNSPHVKKLNGIVATMKKNATQNLTTGGNVTIGSVAPDFSLPSFEGDIIKLSSFKNKYVFLHFWASWSSPSIIDLENIKRIYWAYFPKFQIIQISLDQDNTAWQEAIKKYELKYYYEVSDLKTWASPVARAYGIKSLPANILIAPDGKIVAMNLFGNDLDQKLKEYFGE